jgi:hypothetical protein
MTQQLYKKVGRKYVPIGYSDGWQGFPTDGFWLVQTKPGVKSSECIIKIDELENLKPAANLIFEYKDKLIKVLMNNQCYLNTNANDLALKILKELTK